MIPILYRNEETNFVTNGIGRLSDCISCTVTEERNGAYECEFKYPISGERYNDIENGCIIYCTHDETQVPQAFIIYGHSAPINGVVTFYAHHISYKLSKLVVMPFKASSIQDTLNKLKLNISTANNFTFWTDKTTVGNYTLDVPTTVRSMLGGQEGSILDIYGKGDYEWDMFTVKLHANRGQDSGVEIRYGKNLVDITDEVDGGEVYNAVVPFWKSSDESGTVVTLPESVLVYSEATRRLVDLTDHLLNIIRTQGGEPIEVPISIKEVIPLDLSQEFQDQPTVAQLREKAVSVLETSGGWNPSQNITVDFVALWQTEEYKDFAPLQRVKLCDTVSVYYPELGVNAEKKKVVKTTYNVLLERYDEIELGDLQYSFSQIVAESLKEEVPTSSMMQSAIDNATKLITGGLGGHVYLKPNANGYPEEILVMDDSDYTQANKLWRWNLNGLGYSNTGYNGTYGTAITMDGQIVADFITAGTLNANIIKAGVLSDVNGNTSFNLNTGALTMKSGSINLGDGNFIVDNSGTLTIKKGNISLGNGTFYASDEGWLRIGQNFSVTAGGSINAKAGFIGGFNIYSEYMNAHVGKRFVSFLQDDMLYASYNSTRVFQIADTYSYIGYSNSSVYLDSTSATMKGANGAYVTANYNSVGLVNRTGSVWLSVQNSDMKMALGTTVSTGVPNLRVVDTALRYTSHANSSRKVKKEITKNILCEIAPERLYDVDIVQFKYKDGYIDEKDSRADTPLVGFIVEDLNKIYPNAVDKESEDSEKWGWNSTYIIPPMLKLIQDQHKEIEKLKQKLS